MDQDSVLSIQTLPELLEYSWANAPPGRETAVRNELLRAVAKLGADTLGFLTL